MDIEHFTKLIDKYQKKWVALSKDEVIAHGDSVKEVNRIAEKSNKEFSLFLVPEKNVGMAPFLFR